MRILAPHVRWTRVAVVGLLAIAAPGAIAFEAWRATQRHRQAAGRALEDYAGSAAHTFRERFISRVYFAVDAIFEPVGHAGQLVATGPLPPINLLRQASEEIRRCVECGPALLPAYYFRLTLADSSLQVDGPPLPSGRRAELIARLSRLAEAREAPRWYNSIVDTLGVAPEVIYLTVRRGPGERPLAVYGFAVELASLARTMLRPILDRPSLLPLAQTLGLPNDSLLSVTILEPKGRRALELSPRRQPDTYSASIHGSRFLGAWTLRVALDPASAPPILIGGLPPSRAVPLAMMVLVTAVLVATTVFAAWRALELARLRADFLASVSHELRTPLAQILLFGESLSLGRMRSRHDVRAAGNIIVGEARRLLQLVENVMLFGRKTRAAAPPLAPEPLAPLVREVVASFGPVAAASAARVRIARLDQVIVPVECGAIRQVLLNLLDNAAKYGPRGQTISVGLARVGRQARLWVEDEGPGIPAADRERVWQPFIRLARDLNTSTAGSGIGLALVRELVQLHGGTARIDTTPTGGACVVIELPGSAPEEQPCAS